MAFTPLTSGDLRDVETTAQVSCPVRVSPMVDVEDDHGAVFLVDAVTDAILAPPCPPQPFERCSERSTHCAWSLTQRPLYELPRCDGCSGRSGRERLRERTPRARREGDAVGRLVWGFSRHGARADGARP
jgi:hypothetical protein